MPEESAVNGEMTDAVMTLQEVAAYLKVSEKTITRMVQAGELPGLKVSNQWRFIRAAIDDWLTRRMYNQASEQLAEVIQPPHEELSLPLLLTPNRIILDLQPGPQEDVLARLVAPLIKEGTVTDPTRYMAALIGREKIVSTAIGDGVAIPHARDPEHSALAKSCMALGICRDGMPFGAIDKKPTKLFFLIGGTSTEDHLRLVARTMLMLRKPDFIDALVAAQTREVACELVATASGVGA
ncbi:MAG: PTS sugar transporter subunit IIA [Kiritimatiellia bacterium]|jgi:PTS system nitrogen regulatory IIA component|nr:PTS sugar transporter subunit IIA [Kiritimatiellia bacterium]MDP6809481.1 PTS sugar transporter subunit IIA [Kiritimatiellia bacterium]MDP7023842.1 PTS sugar transporter subunit IIA [Kiritimatiellia bacterium]